MSKGSQDNNNQNQEHEEGKKLTKDTLKRLQGGADNQSHERFVVDPTKSSS